MINFYRLKIWYDLNPTGDKISEILGVHSINSNSPWLLVLAEEEKDPPIDYINYFLNLLENKYERLLKIGIKREDISIWRYYKYDNGQCNLEYSPEETSRLGENGITLCISCLDSEETSFD
jgi:hypothetical protein